MNHSRTLRTLTALTLIASATSGCAMFQRRSNLPVTVALDNAAFDHLTEGGDKVSAGDAPHPDGHPDAHFTAHVQGAITALILTICEDEGNNTGTQWDTIVGQDPIPEGFMHHLGAETWVLGVVGPDGHMLNRDDGIMPETDFHAGSTIQLYVGMRETLQPGRTMCLTALRANGPPVVTHAELTAESTGQPPTEGTDQPATPSAAPTP